jgi:hypothetical protein
MKKRIIILIVSAVLLIGVVTTGVILYQKGIIFPSSSKTQVEPAKVAKITYKGQDHFTALLLLQNTAKVKTSGTGTMAFVTTINGIKADSSKNQYWAFEVNGKTATVGAGSYITKKGDTITWELKTY